MKEENEQMRVLTDEEELLYLIACSQPLRDVAILMLETGMTAVESLGASLSRAAK